MHTVKNSSLIFFLFLVLLISCSTERLHIADKIERPQKIVLGLTSGLDQNEEWREGFQQLGYKVLMENELRLSSQNSGSINSNEQISQNTIGNEVLYIYEISYRTEWDFVNYVSFFNLSVKDLRTRKLIGTYSDRNHWRHPSIKDVTKQIEDEFLTKLIYK